MQGFGLSLFFCSWFATVRGITRLFCDRSHFGAYLSVGRVVALCGFGVLPSCFVSPRHFFVLFGGLVVLNALYELVYIFMLL